MITTAKAGASLQFAQSVFTRGTDVFGPNEIKEAFGIDIPEDQVLSIPFSEEELITARRLGQVLVLQVPGVTMAQIHDRRGNKTSDNKSLYCNTSWYRKEPFFTEDPLVGGWKLITREVLPSSLGQNYLQQTGTLTAYLGEVFGGDASPDVLAAIGEFDAQHQELKALIDNDWKKAAEGLADLKISQMFRPSPVEVLWLMTMYEVVNHERLLPNVWTWTNKRSSFGGLVFVGSFGEDGVFVGSADPRHRPGYLGAWFARSGALES